MNPLDEWTTRVALALGLDPDVLDRDLLLDLTRDVAHGVARPAAPLTAYLVGVAAGRDGARRQDAAQAVGTVAALLTTPGSPSSS